MLYAVRLIGFIVSMITFTIMLAWKFHWVGMTSLLPGLPAMTFNTALGLFLAGVSLITLGWPNGSTYRSDWLRAISLLSASLVGLLVVLTSFQMMFGVNLGIDEFFVLDMEARSGGTTHAPGRMSQATALALFLLSVAISLCSVRWWHGPMKWLTSACALGGLATGAMTGVSMLLAEGTIWNVPFFSTMALHTAWLVVLIGFAVIMFQFAHEGREARSEGRGTTTMMGMWITTVIFVVFALGIVVTAMVSKRTSMREIEMAEARFSQLAERVIGESERRIRLPIYGLRGLKGLYAGSESVTRDEFRAYVEARGLQEEFPGTIGMGFVVRVPAEHMPGYLAAQRAAQSPEYELKTVGEHEVFYPIKYVEPLERNRPAWGYDVGSEANRREAVETAIRTGTPRLTKSIILVQDELAQPGFLFCVPVYQNGLPTETEEDRIASINGVVYSAIVVSGIFDGVIEVAEGGVHYGVYEGNDVSGETKLYEDLGGGAISTGATPSKVNPNAKFEKARSVSAGGRTWTIRTVSSPEFDAAVHSSQSTMVALYGLVLSTLAACFVWLLGCARADALALAHRKTQDLQTTTEDLRHSAEVIAKQNADLGAMAERAHRVVDDVSHEFRTPLAVIKEFASIINDGLAGPVSDQQAQYLRIMSGAVVDLNHMVEDLLDSSKLRAGRLRVERRSYAVETIFETGRAALARKASSRSIVIEEQVEDGLPDVFADEEKVRRVISNLMTNAIKFSPEGSTIILSATRSDVPGQVRIGVTDRGPGLSEEDIDSLFGRFQQVSTARSVAAKGFGLGLSIAEELTWLNLGKISVESEKGKGATFSFTLPCDDPATVIDHYFTTMAATDRADDDLVLLHVVAEDCDDAQETASFLSSITYPTDLVLADVTNNADSGLGSRSWWLLGRTGSVESWVARIDRARRSLIEGDGLDLSPLRIDVKRTWWYPAEAAKAKQEIEQTVLGVATHV